MNNKGMTIYNLFPPLAGNYTQWKNHLPRISKMGFNWIFVNPVQLPGLSGSLYGIKDYFALNPLFVDPALKKTPEDQIRDTLKTASDLGINFMVDLVINHSAINSPLILEHPDWYEYDNGKVRHPSAQEGDHTVVWGDLAKFNHHTWDQEDLFQYFFKIVKFLIGLGFKGFRCDAAYQVPKYLWERLIRETKNSYHDIEFLAETLGCSEHETKETASAGFDYIFNNAKWWDFNGSWLIDQYESTRHSSASVTFPESHDTARLCEELQGNVAGIKKHYLFSALFSAGVMIPMGFEYGFRRRLHVVDTRPSWWENTNIDLCDFITKVNNIKSTYSVFQEESSTEILYIGNPQILFMKKGSTLLILNKDINNKQYFSENVHNILSGTPVDISPEYALDYIPTPFSYDLRPGQGIVLIKK